MKKVLIVEDNLVIAMASQLYVERMGHKVVGTVTSGNDALEVVAKEAVDIILMDLMLEGSMDGVETMQAVRKVCAPVVVYITGNSDLVKRYQKEDPAATFLIKPISELMLKEALEKVLV